MNNLSWLIFIWFYKKKLKTYEPDWEEHCQYSMGCMECDGAYCKTSRFI